MADEGTLVDLLEGGIDVHQNPLLTLKKGALQPVDIQIFEQNFPEFFKDVKKARKMHGSFSYLNSYRVLGGGVSEIVYI